MISNYTNMVVHECPIRSAIDIFVKISVVYCINIEHIRVRTKWLEFIDLPVSVVGKMRISMFQIIPVPGEFPRFNAFAVTLLQNVLKFHSDQKWSISRDIRWKMLNSRSIVKELQCDVILTDYAVTVHQEKCCIVLFIVSLYCTSGIAPD